VTQLLEPWCRDDACPSSPPRCRSCRRHLEHTFLDLGMVPAGGRSVPADRGHETEPFVALRLRVCDGCWLVQWDRPGPIAGPASPDVLDLDTAVAEGAAVDAMVARFRLGPAHRVVDVGGRGRGLGGHFAARGIPTVAVEPTADAARQLVAEGVRADLLVADDVLARAGALVDVGAALKVLLARGGVLTAQLPAAGALLRGPRFEALVRGHRTWFTLHAVEHVLAAHGLKVFDAEERSSDGWLRIHAGHAGEVGPAVTDRMRQMRDDERAAGSDRLETYLDVARQVVETKHRLLRFLLDARASGERVVGFGEAAAGDTFLTYCGIRPDLLESTCGDRPDNGRVLPGSRIPVVPRRTLRETRPDCVLVLPGRPQDEAIAELAHVREWGARVVVPLPELLIL
jgi:hypothetical protein